jgi:hypothetical protein
MNEIKSKKKSCKKSKKSIPEIKMPMRMENDHEHVSALLDEAERLNALGNRWLQAQNPNYIAAEQALKNGWAMNLAACWLRCKLNKEFNNIK